MLEPEEKKHFKFVFHKILPDGSPLNFQVEVAGETARGAAEGLRAAFASMIADINEKYPPVKVPTESRPKSG